MAAPLPWQRVAGTTTRSRWIALQGAANVRDLGGLPLGGGGTTAPGVLLRADNLQGLTASDVRRLVGDLGVRAVVDLRTEVEVELEGPGPLMREERVEIHHRSLMPEFGAQEHAGRRRPVAAQRQSPEVAHVGGALQRDPP